MRLYFGAIAALATAGLLAGAEHRGQVTFNALPVPGATVRVAGCGPARAVITDIRGAYRFDGIAEGTCTISVEMIGFATERREFAVAPDAPPAMWELRMLPLDQIQAAAPRGASPQAPAAAPAPGQTHRPIVPPKPESSGETDDDLALRAADGLLINGSVNSGNASPFGQAAAFGNSRLRGRGLYNGGLAMLMSDSALDARPFSLTGQDTPKPGYRRTTGVLTFGGPLRIPNLLRNGPNFFLAYEWTRNANATTRSTLMPTAAERNGIFNQPITDPLSGQRFAGDAIPASRIARPAASLLSFYPLPNFDANARYNYQTALLAPTHQDALQSRVQQMFGPKDQVFGRFAFQSTRSDAPNLFGFLDTSDSLGINADANWLHRFGQKVFLTLGYQFSRFAARTSPNFAYRRNVSGEAGISGNAQDPMNWGPPALEFASGIAGLSDAQSGFDRNQTSGVSASVLLSRGPHTVTFGADFRRRQFNVLGQQQPRGAFTFTGTATGIDFADFLLGLPAAASVAFGNADKYFRASTYDAYANDDWRVAPSLTLNLGVRWDYGSPLTELYGRIVNLDIVPGFAAAAPVTAGASGPLTGTRYPDSLVRPDKLRFSPRAGLAWRPIPANSLVVRAGYGVYYDTSIYETLASQMAQQPPLSKVARLSSSASNPLTLANGFNATAAGLNNTFALDPGLRVGYAQVWQLSVQRSLPGSLQMVAAYLGNKGTHALQSYLPNTRPTGVTEACGGCPSGFTYVTSGANSTRHAAQAQLRRRLRNGFTAMLQYTFSKSIDDAAVLGGLAAQSGGAGQNGPTSASAAPAGIARLAIAQNWLDPRAERGLSTFDQRHVLSLDGQYTTGMHFGAGVLPNGWAGALMREWTFGGQIAAASGVPQTPVYVAPVQGTGVTGTIRPDYTGLPLYDAGPGLFLNPSAYRAPSPGRWGNAGRNTIIGPSRFVLNASLGRTFRLTDRLNLDVRIDSSNALNRVNYSAWNTTVNGAQFGLPVAANPMRSMQITMRVRF